MSEISARALMDTIDRLEDLKKQATIERSHFYTANVITDTIATLYACLKALHGERG